MPLHFRKCNHLQEFRDVEIQQNRRYFSYCIALKESVAYVQEATVGQILLTLCAVLLLMAAAQRRLELNCILCSHPLISLQSSLPEDVLQLVLEQSTGAKLKKDISDYNHLDSEQVVATRCGHMYV